MRPDPPGILTRAARPPDHTLRYGDHPDHVIDVRLPAAPGRPLVIFVHGGFWRPAYDRSHTGPLAADLADRGWPVATIEYRRVRRRDGCGYPLTLDDAAAAVDAAIAAGLGTGVPILAGHSAGGHLALWYASRGPVGVRGVLGLAPVCDFASAYDHGIGDHAVRDLLGGGPTDVPERYAAADPLGLRLAVPALLLHGTADLHVPVELSRTYAAGVAGTRLIELPGVDHFAVIDPESMAWPSVLSALTDLTGPTYA